MILKRHSKKYFSIVKALLDEIQPQLGLKILSKKFSNLVKIPHEYVHCAITIIITDAHMYLTTVKAKQLFTTRVFLTWTFSFPG